MKRLREISRFECDVRVLRNGFCMVALVPIETRSLTDAQGNTSAREISFRAMFTNSVIPTSLNYQAMDCCLRETA